MTATFVLYATTPLAPPAALERLLDLDRHEALAAGTTLTWTPPLEAGARFTARTALGPVGFDDVMEVRDLRPAYVRIVKVGRVLTGATEISIVTDPSHGDSRVEWRQSLGIRGVPSVLDPAVGAVARVFYRRMLTGLLR